MGSRRLVGLERGEVLLHQLGLGLGLQLGKVPLHQWEGAPNPSPNPNPDPNPYPYPNPNPHPNPNPNSKVLLHQWDVMHGVHVTSGERYSLVLWCSESADAMARGDCPWVRRAANHNPNPKPKPKPKPKPNPEPSP